MNREQMVAWLALEGYRPYAYPDLGGGFTLSRDGRIGVWIARASAGYYAPANEKVEEEEIEFGWDDVPYDQVLIGYTYLTKEKDHAS